MTIFVLFICIGFLSGILMRKQSMERMYWLAAFVTVVMVGGYFFLDWI